MLLRIPVNPKAAVRKGMFSSLPPWQPFLARVEKRATVVVRLWHRGAITAVLAIEDYSRAGKQELSHTGRHCAAPYKVPAPTFAPNTPSLPPPPALIQGQPLGVPRCLSSAAQLLRQLRDDCVFSGGIFLQTCSISRHFACHLLCHPSGTLLQAGKFQTYDFGKKTNELLEIGKFLGFTGSGRSGCGCSKRVGGWE